MEGGLGNNTANWSLVFQSSALNCCEFHPFMLKWYFFFFELETAYKLLWDLIMLLPLSSDEIIKLESLFLQIKLTGQTRGTNDWML